VRRPVVTWRVSADPKTNGYTHRISEGRGHGLFIPIVTHVFELLRVSASVSGSGLWWAIHNEPNVSEFEVEHGLGAERYAYNDAIRSESMARKRAVRAEHAGTCDLFVPIVLEGEAIAVLVVGPVASKRASSADILSRWRCLTGRQGHPADPEFASYLATTLSTLVLEGGRMLALERLLDRLAKLMAGEGRADALANEADALRRELEPARRAERTWDAVQGMVDDRRPRTWSTAQRAYDLYTLGLERPADHLLVGLTVSRAEASDPVDEAVRRDAFQRACVELARSAGAAIAGRAGDHGVVLLSARAGSASAKKRRLLELCDRLASLARRRFGFSLHCGAAAAASSVPLSRSYQAAFGAAGAALGSGARMVMADVGASQAASPLRRLRSDLGAKVEESPSLLGARFDRYVEAVALHCGYRLESARRELDAGFERVADPLLSSGGLDVKSFDALCETLDRGAREARTMGDLSAVYRRAVVDVAEAVERPAAARRDRSLRRALDYIHQHYTEPLALSKVARVSGFAPYYFSHLLREREKMTFADYVTRLRIERSRQLLADTELSVGRVSELSGFRSAQYFCRVFRAASGATPGAYRARLRNAQGIQYKKKHEPVQP
jgi:AraC-like DNA-binding protein